MDNLKGKIVIINCGQNNTTPLIYEIIKLCQEKGDMLHMEWLKYRCHDYWIMGWENIIYS